MTRRTSSSCTSGRMTTRRSSRKDCMRHWHRPTRSEARNLPPRALRVERGTTHAALRLPRIAGIRMWDVETAGTRHRRLMLALAAAPVSLLIAMAGAAHPAAPLVVEARIPLGDVHGRIEHLGIDLERHRLYVAELGNDSVGVVDLQAGKAVRTLGGLEEPQGIGYDASTD